MWCQKRELYYFSMWVSKKRHTERERERERDIKTKKRNSREREKKRHSFLKRDNTLYTHARAL